MDDSAAREIKGSYIEQGIDISVGQEILGRPYGMRHNGVYDCRESDAVSQIRGHLTPLGKRPRHNGGRVAANAN
jgi:hypothetical protein